MDALSAAVHLVRLVRLARPRELPPVSCLAALSRPSLLGKVSVVGRCAFSILLLLLITSVFAFIFGRLPTQCPEDIIQRNSNISLLTSPTPDEYQNPHLRPRKLERKRRKISSMFSTKSIRKIGSMESIGSDVSTDRSSIDSRQSWHSPGTSPESSPRHSADSFDPSDKPGKTVKTVVSWSGSKLGGFPSPRLMKLSKSQVGAPKGASDETFNKLPTEILMSILAELRRLHLDIEEETVTCATCWMRDLCNLSVTSRKWAVAAQAKLYGSIYLIGSDSVSSVKMRFKASTASRFKVLRRTLRENTGLAEQVKDLRVPDISETATAPKDQEKYLDAVASLVMCCPNLERLLGLHPAYNHEFSRLFHALASRPNLVEHVWNIAATDYQLQHCANNGASRARFNFMPFPINTEQTNAFSQHHTSWLKLSTLVIHCTLGGTISGPVLSATISMLPSLKRLALSSLPPLPPNFFASLPALESLHLANLPALSSHHLTALSTSACARSLTSLALIHTPLLSLPLFARLLCNLLSLRRLCIIQDPSPNLPNETNIYMHPYLFSPTLKHLTWDILHPSSPRNCDATLILSKAIKAGGFPALESITAPCDYDGFLQRVCKPCTSLTRSTFPSPIGTGRPRGTSIGSVTSSSSGDVASELNLCEHSVSSISSSSSSSSSSDSDSDNLENSSAYLARLRSNSQPLSRPKLGNNSALLSRTRSLAAARSVARSRIRLARSKPKFQVVVEDWTYAYRIAERVAGVQFVAKFDIGTYVGVVGTDAKCNYVLAPDVEGRDEVGVRVEDVLEAAQEESVTVSIDGIVAAAGGVRTGMGMGNGRKKNLCDGRWNWDGSGERKGDRRGAVAEGKQKRNGASYGWGHKERIIWEEFGVDRLF